MEDNLVGNFNLAVGLSMSDSSKLGLPLEGSQIICDLGGVKVPSIIENQWARDTKAGDDILLNKLLNFSRCQGLTMGVRGMVGSR